MDEQLLIDYLVTGIFTIVNLVVTYWILRLLLFKPVMKFMRKRQESVESQIREARGRMEEAEVRVAEAAGKLDSAVREASTIVSDAKHQAEAQSEAILVKARQDASSLTFRAEADIERLKTAALDQMREEVADLSVKIASKVIGRILDEQRSRELVDTLLEEELKGKVRPNG